MEKTLNFILIGIGVFLIVGVLAVGYYVRNSFDHGLDPVRQVVAVDVLVSDEWSEIVPVSPMTVTKRTQSVYFEIEGFIQDAKKANKEIKLADGTLVRPELEIVDEHGKTYAMEFMQTNSVEFSLDWEKNGKKPFPNDRNYPKLRIRSDKPFRCSKIVWIDRDVK